MMLGNGCARATILAVLLVLAGLARAAEDSTAPAISNLVVITTNTSTASTSAKGTICLQVTDSESGVSSGDLSLTNGAKRWNVGLPGNVSRIPVYAQGNAPCSSDGSPLACCTGSGIGNCTPALPSCSGGNVGQVAEVRDCATDDGCGTGGGAFTNLVTCSSSTWTVRTTTSAPATRCVENVDLVPRWSAGGTWTINIEAHDQLGNTTLATGASLGTASITTTP